jgi:streptogramin lyase
LPESALSAIAGIGKDMSVDCVGKAHVHDWGTKVSINLHNPRTGKFEIYPLGKANTFVFCDMDWRRKTAGLVV